MNQEFKNHRSKQSDLKVWCFLKLAGFIFMLLLLIQNLQAQSYVQIPATGGIPSPASTPTFSYGFGSSLNVRAAMLYRPSEMNNYPVASPIERIGFKLAGPTPGFLPWSLIVLFKIYVIPTTDTIYNLSPNWATFINPTSGFIRVYDGGLLIPSSTSPPVTGYFDFVLQTPFTLPPNHGFYLAYESENTLISAVAAPFECDTTLANGYHFGLNNSHSPQTAPSTLTSSNNYRHVLRLGYSGGATGIGEKQSINSINVYPNPAQDVLNIDPGSFGKSEIQVILRDPAGKVIKTENLISKQKQIRLNGISPGIYSLQISSPTETVVKRIVKQ